MHDVALSPENVPGRQVEHPIALVLENVPGTQPVHSPFSWNVPGGHALQAGSEFPSFDDTVPAGHERHASSPPLPPASRYVSLGHAVQALEPWDAHHPSGQLVQLFARSSAYVPFGHTSHVTPVMDEAVPALHTPHVVFRPVSLDAVPGAHVVQSTSVWASHAVHPGSRLYLPAWHCLQGPPASHACQ